MENNNYLLKHAGHEYMLLKEKIRVAITRMGLYRPVLWIYEGKETGSGLNLKIAIAARAPIRALIISIAFQGEPLTKRRRRCWQWRLQTCALSEGAELLVIDSSATSVTASKALSTAFLIPTWINGVIDFQDAFQRFKKSSYIKRELQRHRSKNLEYEIISDPTELLENFYHKMYLPFCINRHGSKANAGSLKQLLNDSPNKEFACVKKDGELLAGHILHFQNGGVRGRQLGTKDGRADLLKLGVVSKLYYHNILNLAERGYSEIHFGGSRPFLSDGVLQNKIKWGLHLDYDENENRPFMLLPLGESAAVDNFLQNNPFLTIEGDKIIGHIFLQENIATQEEDSELLINKYWMPGMERLDIHSTDENNYPIIRTKDAQ